MAIHLSKIARFIDFHCVRRMSPNAVIQMIADRMNMPVTVCLFVCVVCDRAKNTEMVFPMGGGASHT